MKLLAALLPFVLLASVAAEQNTYAPSFLPTPSPTNAPTPNPTAAPTNAPTPNPTAAPTDAPTNAPTNAPTDAPTNAPTNAPTDAPTNAPTDAPTNAPTNAPTDAPTNAPTDAPTNAPTNAPTDAPTTLSEQPTKAPTPVPTCDTEAPTKSPTEPPTPPPTEPPTPSPTEPPTTPPTPPPTCTEAWQSCNLPGTRRFLQAGPSVDTCCDGTECRQVGADGEGRCLPPCDSCDGCMELMDPCNLHLAEDPCCDGTTCTNVDGTKWGRCLVIPSGCPTDAPTKRPVWQSDSWTSDSWTSDDHAPPTNHPTRHPTNHPVAHTPTWSDDGHAPTFTCQGQWWADYDSDSCKCDCPVGSDPSCKPAAPPISMYGSISTCCAQGLNWIDTLYCESRSEGGYSDGWAVDWAANTCVKDCDPANGAPCASVASSSPLFSTRALCCARIPWVSNC